MSERRRVGAGVGRTGARPGLGLALWLVVAGGCCAGPPAAPPGPPAGAPAARAAPAVGDHVGDHVVVRVDVVADDRPLPEVLARLGQQVGWNLVCEPAAADVRVSLRVFDLPWRDALDLVLARARAEAAPAGERTLYVTCPPLVTLRSW
ncbi:MAG: hypothetical protein KF878_17075 [Planctomycetes bacterium]|nr:hypothetical protein [Planctomycetota bacterium]